MPGWCYQQATCHHRNHSLSSQISVLEIWCFSALTFIFKSSITRTVSEWNSCSFCMCRYSAITGKCVRIFFHTPWDTTHLTPTYNNHLPPITHLWISWNVQICDIATWHLAILFPMMMTKQNCEFMPQWTYANHKPKIHSSITNTRLSVASVFHIPFFICRNHSL